ncbi:transporter [Ganoderma sinense ZZ0214-1]|uniref:Transporter n=1 Tax=Ganoderma sinense ZZ0214-1 TaxID=1077348 RepID=A0A2G8SVF4_9APHY|nr:transporter [Ganoderma sinense ZZ0214-1]
MPSPSDLGCDSSGAANGTVPAPGNSGANALSAPDNILNSRYASARRELLELVRDLHALGHAKTLDVPQIAVIGKQSAGKSSLVEAVAGINVPRDAGTCTRCPMECTLLTSSDKWSCAISLRGDHINEAFSPEITSKADVELWIRRAQAAVLCPHLHMGRFKTMSHEEIKHATDHTVDPEVKRFSNTVVEVKILDPDGTDLVFVDLPGLIPNADDEIVKQVEDMVKDYISQPSTIILVTVPAEDDLENQKAMKLAKDADPRGERTIGVVTKADKIQPGETGRQKAWRDIFEGSAREHKLSLGYYAVRLPTDEERARKITPAQARDQAARVFDTVVPWKDVKAFPGPTRLGVEALIRDLSPLLLNMLIAAIPRLKAAVDQLLAACLADLARIPARAKMDGATELVLLVLRFCEAVEQTVDGTSGDKSFVHGSRTHYRALKGAIRCTAPDFRPFENPAEYYMPPAPGSQQREDVFVDLPLVPPLPRSQQHKDHFPDLPSVPPLSPPSEAASECSRSASPAPSVEFVLDGSVPGNEGVVMGLLDVRQVIKESTGWELPHNIPYLAKTRLIREFVQRWAEPSKTCFASIRRLVEKYVYETLIPRHFEQFPSLGRFVTERLRENMAGYLDRCETAVQQALEREEIPYFTQNGHYLEVTRELWLGHYKEVRAQRDKYRRSSTFASTTSYLNYSSRAVTEALAAIRMLQGYSNITATDLPKLLPADEYIDELGVMADVRSYFQVAYKRVIDNVPHTIHHAFVQGFAQGLRPYLLGKLDIGGEDAPQRLEKLLEEDPEVLRARKELEDRRTRLEDIKARLNIFRV